jgi:protein-tyrosine-phosphatase
MITMDGHTRPARRLVPDELEQVMRLARFRQAHPGVMVGAGRGWWQAVIPEPDGEQVITRYTLGQLLDRLDELIGG